jgi:hypothetical protein
MNLGFAKRLMGDLPENQMCAQPHGLVVKVNTGVYPWSLIAAEP